jgi:hypothetical protein
MNTTPAASNVRIQAISFEVPELLLVTAWAEFHSLRMTIELDWCADGIAYEEVITLQPAERNGPPWLLWRTCESVVLQPMAGKPRRFETISDALEAVCPEQV